MSQLMVLTRLSTLKACEGTHIHKVAPIGHGHNGKSTLTAGFLLSASSLVGTVLLIAYIPWLTTRSPALARFLVAPPQP